MEDDVSTLHGVVGGCEPTLGEQVMSFIRVLFFLEVLGRSGQVGIVSSLDWEDCDSSSGRSAAYKSRTCARFPWHESGQECLSF